MFRAPFHAALQCMPSAETRCQIPLPQAVMLAPQPSGRWKRYSKTWSTSWKRATESY